ncbi:hypothetical protein BHM03_00005043 [Ensete ventricosum]|uniref:Uncharacterized protein n=1 Tax=Ensete ventricosum TaxID=4639 RepID=A0A445MAZ5_ENSVE|nr:hypothetical protein BHM03_00005043 [Ensete ventricosum]
MADPAPTLQGWGCCNVTRVAHANRHYCPGKKRETTHVPAQRPEKPVSFHGWALGRTKASHAAGPTRRLSCPPLYLYRKHAEVANALQGRPHGFSDGGGWCQVESERYPLNLLEVELGVDLYVLSRWVPAHRLNVVPCVPGRLRAMWHRLI